METATQQVASPGQYLRDERVRRGITLRRLTELTGISTPSLSNIERGLPMTAEQAFLLSAFYEIPLGKIYTPPSLPTTETN